MPACRRCFARTRETRLCRLEIEYHSGRTGSNILALRVGRLDAAFVSGECGG
jgi:hypothetical protein